MQKAACEVWASGIAGRRSHVFILHFVFFMTRSLVAALVAVTMTTTPSFAQADMSGTWQSRFGVVNVYPEDQAERGPGPELGDYLGLPISNAARQFADSWDPSRITLPEEQCRVHVSPYIYRGPLNLRMWEE